MKQQPIAIIIFFGAVYYYYYYYYYYRSYNWYSMQRVRLLFFKVLGTNTIDVRRVNCKMLYFNCLVFFCVRVLHSKTFVSNVIIVGDVLHCKESQ